MAPDPLRAWVNAHYAPALRQQVYTRLRSRGFVPPGAGSPAAPAPDEPVSPGVPGGPDPLPTSIAQQTAIDNILAAIGAQPALYNPQRRALAAQTARGLTDAGFYETISPIEQVSGSNLSYQLQGGPEGRVFRQARTGAAGQFNSRGAYFGSARVDAQRDAERDLGNQREGQLRSFGAQQDRISADQAERTSALDASLREARAGYADWQAAQQVPMPPASVAAPAMPGPAPQAPRAAARVVPRPPARPAPIPRLTNPRLTGWTMRGRGLRGWRI